MDASTSSFVPDTKPLLDNIEESFVCPKQPLTTPVPICATSQAESVVAVPKMPQHLGPHNSGGSDPVVAMPTFAVPPHLMGRNLDNPIADMIGTGRRVQKPRLGVRVPYRNLTSQIVTQDEIAQEIFERNQKKYPMHDIPEGGDMFFAMKLTQRLANRIAPSTPETSPSKSDPQTETDPLAITPNNSGPLSESELLAILDDKDGISDWVPESKVGLLPGGILTETTIIEHIRPPQPLTPFKLDPAVERELALKQLMELPLRAKRKKSEDKQPKSDKPSKKKARIPKIKNNLGEVVNTGNNVKTLTAQNSSQNSLNVTGVGRLKMATEKGLGIVAKKNIVRTKRTCENMSGSPAKRLQASKKKQPALAGVVALSTSNTAKDSTNIQVKAGHSGVHKSSMPSSKLVNGAKSTETVQAKEKKFHKVTIPSQISVMATKVINLLSSPKRSVAISPAMINDGKSGSVPSPNQSLVDSITLAAQPMDGTTITDIPFVQTAKLAVHPRTYSGKKRINAATNSSPTQLGDPSTSLASGSQLKQVFPKTTVSNVKSAKDGISKGKTMPTEEVSAVAKKRKSRMMREVNRLLQDEGAINFIYEVEHGESKRRSSNGVEKTTANIRRGAVPLKSIRRKRKDLLLKTRLVKNAVMRLGSSNAGFTPLATRPKRLTRPPILMKQDKLSPESSQLNRLSVDSQDSLGSPSSQTHVEPPSPPFFSPRHHLRAEASRIIRRHSSSSTYSSRSGSPQRLSIDKEIPLSPNTAPSTFSVTQPEQETRNKLTRKKGVPIFVRKFERVQTYKGKKRKATLPNAVLETTSILGDMSKESPNTKVPVEKVTKSVDQSEGIPTVAGQFVKGSNKTVQSMKNKPQLNGDAAQIEPLKKATTILGNKRKMVDSVNFKTKTDASVNMKLKAQMSKNFNQGLVKGRSLELKTAVAGTDGASTKPKKETVTSTLEPRVSELVGKLKKKLPESKESSKSSSPNQSRGSKSPTPVIRPLPPPLSPSTSSYCSLVKTLECESQKQQKKKEVEEETGKQRASGRQNAGTFIYREICLRRHSNLVQIILAPVSTKMKNSFNLQVLRELIDALYQLRKDETCRVVLLSSTGSSFCQGVDLAMLLHTNIERRKSTAQELAAALKQFLKSLALFNKPLVAAVNGSVVGLGVTMLPFFDMVIASDKATFSTPYARLGQVPEGAAILTLPHMLGNAVTSELLFGCRKLTASEALRFGLVTRVLWPDRFQEEVLPLVAGMANQSAQLCQHLSWTLLMLWKTICQPPSTPVSIVGAHVWAQHNKSL
uniref:Uncharacterized protein n=1 Tax=Timema poppense TaxID=170557 RepID=A0A7R9D6E4_TIMPO|nr:unnamed protein product [Timema poppensis]